MFSFNYCDILFHISMRCLTILATIEGVKLLHFSNWYSLHIFAMLAVAIASILPFVSLLQEALIRADNFSIDAAVPTSASGIGPSSSSSASATNQSLRSLTNLTSATFLLYVAVQVTCLFASHRYANLGKFLLQLMVDREPSALQAAAFSAATFLAFISSMLLVFRPKAKLIRR